MFKTRRAVRAEVQAARRVRDDLQKKAAAASKEADLVIDELLNDYAQAEAQRKTNGGR